MNFFHEYHSETKILHNQKIYFDAHLHYEVEIIALFRGSTSLLVGGQDYKMHEGDFLIVFPNTIHSYTTSSPVDVGKFIFSLEAIPELKDAFENKFTESPIIPREKAEKANLHTLSKEILNCYNESSAIVKKAYLLLLTGKLLELCRLQSRDKLDHDIINSIFNYCQNNYLSKITQKDVATALHVSESYLSHIFSKKIEINFCSYINILRINKACESLSDSNKSITQIAQECGFSSLRTFNRAFLKHREITPSEYKKSLAEKAVK